VTIIFEERLSDSPYIETITHGHTMSEGSTIRPAECHWHMVLVKHEEQTQSLIVGPLATSGVASWGEGAEVLWIKFKLGAFMPHLPTKVFLDTETTLPEASGQSFWLNSAAWEFPDFENVETFINRLAREDTLVHDPIVTAALQDQLPEMSSRTVRHRFLQSVGLTQTCVRQMRRAQRAKALLEQGVSILDVVYEAGYFDQPHLTRSLKQFIGYTPAQIVRMSQPDYHSTQNNAPIAEDNLNQSYRLLTEDVS
jgi:AraC-like DNA-binding protein